MPLLAKRAALGDFDSKDGERIAPELELMLICSIGKNYKRLERLLNGSVNVNYKDDDGVTPLHKVCACGSPEFVTRLLEARVDPNVPGTAELTTPLDVLVRKIEQDEAEDAVWNKFEVVNRMDDAMTAIRPDIQPFRRCRELLEAAGAVQGRCREEEEPTVRPDGSVSGGPPCELRAYSLADDGSYSTAGLLRTKKYDVLKYENGMLVRADFDATTGHWDTGDGMTCKDAVPKN